MATELIDRQLMECTTGTSDKFYDVVLTKEGTKYYVRGRYGKRQGDWKNAEEWKNAGGSHTLKGRYENLREGQRAFDEVVRSKKTKRPPYKEVKLPKPKKEKKAEEKTIQEAGLERFANLEF